MLNEAIKMAKGNEEEKAMQSVSMPKSLKDDLVATANGNNVSTNSLIVSILHLAMNNDEIVDGSITKDKYIELIEVEKSIQSFLLPEEHGGELFCGMYCNPGAVEAFPDEISSAISKAKALRKLLI